MKTLKYLFVVLVFASCNNVSKEASKDSSEPNVINQKKPSLITKNEGNDYGNYDKLYTLDNPCKITIEEIATLYGISSNEIDNRIDAKNDCSFLIQLNDNTELFFYVKNQRMPKDIVNNEIDKKLNSSYEKDFIQKANSGGHYIYKHPNQGWLLLYNPDYDNALKIQYRAMLTPGLDKTQKEYREEKGYQVANYLIAKYEN